MIQHHSTNPNSHRNISKSSTPNRNSILTKHQATQKISNELVQLRTLAKKADCKHLVYFIEIAMHQAQEDMR